MKAKTSMIVTSTACFTAVLFFQMPDAAVEANRRTPVGPTSADGQQGEYALHYWENPDDCFGCHYERYKAGVGHPLTPGANRTTRARSQ